MKLAVVNHHHAIGVLAGEAHLVADEDSVPRQTRARTTMLADSARTGRVAFGRA
jgi:hypothetical protein